MAKKNNDGGKTLMERMYGARTSLVQEIKGALLQKFYDLSEEVQGGCRQMRSERSRDVLDQGDSSVVNSQEDLDIHQLERKATELQSVSSALARIKQGDFGICRDCGEGISEVRLRAVNHALRCIGCEEKKRNPEGVPASPSRDNAYAASSSARLGLDPSPATT